MLDVNIEGVEVAVAEHHGLVRVHIGEYLGENAQAHIDNLVARNKDIASALLISEPQTIVIEAQRRTTNAEKLKDIVHGFCSALKQWHSELDELDLAMMSYHPNVQREAHESYSAVASWNMGQ